MPVRDKNREIGKSSRHKDGRMRYANDIKKEARFKTLIDSYRRITKQDRLPPDRVFVSLCNEQTINPSSETCQLIGSGLITEEQYIGIDMDRGTADRQSYAEINSKLFPKATWRQGLWSDEFAKVICIHNPGIIFFDTIHTLPSPMLREDTLDTMRHSRPQTYLVVNAQLEDWRRAKGVYFSPDDFYESLVQSMTKEENDLWGYYGCYQYKAKRVWMGSFAFWRK